MTRLAQEQIQQERTNFDDKLKSLNQKINSNKTKHLLVENELKKLQTFDSIYFRGKSHFEEDGTQNYVAFQPMYRYFKRVSGVGSGNYIYFWKSKGSSDENVTAPKVMKKIYEKNSSFHVKQGNTGKLSFLFFSLFLLVSKKF